MINAYLKAKGQEEFMIGLVVPPPQGEKKGRRFLEASPEEKARDQADTQELKALCEKLEGKVFQIHSTVDNAGRIATISFQKPNR